MEPQGFSKHITRLFKNIRSLVGIDRPQPTMRNRVTEFFDSIRSIAGNGSPPQEFTNQIYAFYNSDSAIFTREERESFFACTIADVPRCDENLKTLNWAYEGLIQELWQQDQARGMEVFKRYLGDYAPVYDPLYDRIYMDAMLATASRPITLRRRDRFFALVQLFRQTLPLQGLVAECGCFRGLSSHLLCNFLKSADSGFDGGGYRIFDSFAGLSEPRSEDIVEGDDSAAKRLRKMTQPGAFAASLEQVKNNLGEFPNIEYFPGWIPQAFPDEPDARYRFVHVDVDIYQPTLDCFEYFYPRLVPGGMIVSDDYGWPGAQKAIEEFCARHQIELKTTGHAQAYIVRPA
jgi:O-methyltransferase